MEVEAVEIQTKMTVNSLKSYLLENSKVCSKYLTKKNTPIKKKNYLTRF